MSIHFTGQYFTARVTAHKQYVVDGVPNVYGWVYDTDVTVEGGLVQTRELPGQATAKVLQAVTDTPLRALRAVLAAAQSEAQGSIVINNKENQL